MLELVPGRKDMLWDAAWCIINYKSDHNPRVGLPDRLCNIPCGADNW
jgi:hypothetical protein